MTIERGSAGSTCFPLRFMWADIGVSRLHNPHIVMLAAKQEMGALINRNETSALQIMSSYSLAALIIQTGN